MSKILFRQESSVNVQYKNQSLLSNRILMVSQISPLKLLINYKIFLKSSNYRSE